MGREQDGIAFLERAIAINRNDQWAHRWLAAAYALAGRVDEAKRSLGEANRLWPYNTVRGFSAGSNAYAVQTARFREALRLAGERDHADEDADFGLPPDGALHNEVAGRTPVSVLGASTIRTAELAHMIAEIPTGHRRYDVSVERPVDPWRRRAEVCRIGRQSR